MKMRAYFFYLISFVPVACAESPVLTLITPRPSTTNLAREMIQRYEAKPHSTSSLIFITPEVIKSFHPEDIADTLLGPIVCSSTHKTTATHCQKEFCNAQKRSCRRSFIVSGSQVSNRNDTDLLADYCGLPTDFESIVSVQPYYTSALADIGTYISCNRLLSNCYLFVHAPIEHSRWTLQLQETIRNSGTEPYPAGYFDTISTNRDNLVSSFRDFCEGVEAPQFEQATYIPLNYSKMSSCGHSVTGISDIEMVFGYNPIDTHDYICGAGIRLSIPGGHAPKARYLFEPLIGATNHYKLGIEANCHMLLWHDQHNNEWCTIEAAVIINHLFLANQYRTFDLKNSPLSRYMLAQKVDTNNEDNLNATIDGNPINPLYIFAHIFEPVANLTTAKIKSSMSVECEFSCMFSFNRDQFSWHIGYDFWIQSREHISVDCCRLQKEQWAIKGNSQVFGFLGAPDGSLPQDSAIALSATQSHATITHGTNTTTASQLTLQNPGIDAPGGATAGLSNTLVLYQPGLANIPANQINTSATPIVLDCNQLDIESSRIAHKANKLFMHMQYTLPEIKTAIPSMGIGAEVDFGTSSCDPRTYTCSYWGIWVHLSCQL